MISENSCIWYACRYEHSCMSLCCICGSWQPFPVMAGWDEAALASEDLQLAAALEASLRRPAGVRRRRKATT